MAEAPPQDESATTGDGAKLERRVTNSAADIPHPGDVRINVKGAFIVDAEDNEGPEEDFEEDGYQHDRKDIRLPNHKAIVSHIAVDVRISNSLHIPIYPNKKKKILRLTYLGLGRCRSVVP